MEKRDDSNDDNHDPEVRGYPETCESEGRENAGEDW